MITAEIVRGQKIPQIFQERGAKFESAVSQAVMILAIKMTGLVKQKLSGDVLKVRTGRLRRSIHYTLENTTNRSTAIVGTNVEYAAIHEFGGTIPAHVIFPKNKQALKFMMGGQVVFAKRVNIPAVTMPQRSFLQSSLDQMMPEIKDTLTRTVNRVMKGETA